MSCKKTIPFVSLMRLPKFAIASSKDEVSLSSVSYKMDLTKHEMFRFLNRRSREYRSLIRGIKNNSLRVLYKSARKKERLNHTSRP